MATTAEQFSRISLDKGPDNSYSGDLINTIELALSENINEQIEYSYINWFVYKGQEIIYEKLGQGLNFSVNIADVLGNKPENAGRYVVQAVLVSANQEGEIDEGSFEIQFTLVGKEETLPQAIYVPFVAQIAAVENDEITINTSWEEFTNKVRPEQEFKSPLEKFTTYEISSKINDYSDLNTYMHLGDDNLSLITNVKKDTETIKNYPNSGI